VTKPAARAQEDWHIRWGSPYCDAYGEEDPNLKRGARLTLDLERWERLEQVWRSQPLRRWNQGKWRNEEMDRHRVRFPF
jgi:hypothetical protein